MKYTLIFVTTDTDGTSKYYQMITGWVPRVGEHIEFKTDALNEPSYTAEIITILHVPTKVGDLDYTGITLKTVMGQVPDYFTDDIHDLV